MIDMNIIGWLFFSFIGFTTINRILEHAWITAADVGIMNYLSITQQTTIGFMTIPVPNTTFISGIFHMALWDYSFFGGQAQLIQFFLYAFTFLVAVSLFFTVLGFAAYALRAR